MLGRDIIKKLSFQYQTTEINIVREYTQHLFLSIFYQYPESEKILFKGGTALRVVFHSPRFSEDLDFSGFQTDISTLETLLLNVTEKIQRFGLETEITESKKTSGGYLGTLDLVSSGYRSRILLQVSLRKQKSVKGEPVLITSDFMSSYTILILPVKILIEEKLSALLERAKPRDYFDLYFLLRKELIKVEQRKVLKEIRKRLEGGNLLLEKELQDFLPRNQQKLIHNFQKVLLQEISRYL